MSGYPVVLNGDHAEFEAEWAGKDPKTRPDWPLPSFDARDWAEAFDHFNPGHNIPEGVMLGWFANSLMRGFDERASRSATPAPATPPGVPDSVRADLQSLVKTLKDTIAVWDKWPETEDGGAEALRQVVPLVERIISAQPAGQSEPPILRVVVEVHPDRTDTRLTFGERIRPEPGVKAVEQAIAALTAEYEARGGCPAVGRHPVGQADDLPDPETAQTNLARIGAAMGLQSKPVAWLLEKPDGETHLSECRPRDDWKDGTVTPLYAAPTIQPAGQAGDEGIEATQITLGEGLVDITRIDHEGRTGVLFRPRKEHIAFGELGELPEGTYWPLKGDVVLWVSGEGPGVAIKALADLAPNSTRTGAAETLPPMPPTLDRALFHPNEPNGYLEGNGDWADANSDAVTWLADNHAAIRAALAARPEAPSDAGWVKIDDKARNGTHWLVARVGSKPVRAWFEHGRWWMHGCGPHSRNLADLTGNFAPTHYQPLPTAPSDPAPSGQAEG